MQLGKKVVVITGAARGLGRAMALAFAARGADIAALDRDGAALGETVAQCSASGVRAKAYVTRAIAQCHSVSGYAVLDHLPASELRPG